MPAVIVKVEPGYVPSNLDCVASIGGIILYGYVPQSQLQALKNEPGVKQVRIEKWLKKYLKEWRR